MYMYMPPQLYGNSRSMASGTGYVQMRVVVEKGSEYILAHTGPRELDGRPQGGAWVGVIPGSFRDDHDRESL